MNRTISFVFVATTLDAVGELLSSIGDRRVRSPRRAPTAAQLSVHVIGPESFHTPGFALGFPSGVNSLLYFLNPPSKSRRFSPGHPSAVNNATAFSDLAPERHLEDWRTWRYVIGQYGVVDSNRFDDVELLEVAAPTATAAVARRREEKRERARAAHPTTNRCVFPGYAALTLSTNFGFGTGAPPCMSATGMFTLPTLCWSSYSPSLRTSM